MGHAGEWLCPSRHLFRLVRRTWFDRHDVQEVVRGSYADA
jgi:hypothetical protein